MSLGKVFLFIGVSSFVLLTQVVTAGETPSASKENGAVPASKGNVAAEKSAKPAADGKVPAAAGDTVEQLIGQLDAADYETREAACGKLAAKGKTAVAALEKAAATGNLEVASRATTVLGKLLKSAEEATEKAAAAALQRLADGDSPAAARKAKSILDKKNMKDNGPGMNGPGGIVLPGNGGFGGQIIIGGGQLNIGVGATMRTMSVKNVNGVKEITASEDGKTVKIQDDPTQGIKVEVTEKVNGKEVTKKYDAKNADDLKKNQPAGYDLYKKYGGEQPGNGVMQFRVQALGGNLQIPGNALPALPAIPGMPLQPALPLQPGMPLQPGQLLPIPGRGAPPIAATPQGGNQLEVATRLAKILSSRLERLQKAEACKNASPESRAELRKQIDELAKRLQDVRGQLGDK